MNYNPDIHHRRSIRLRGYDYSSIGAYFVTICTVGRECLFGEICTGGMILNDTGRLVQEWWQGVPDHFANVILDEYVIMPNHFHGIVVITDVGAGSPRPVANDGEAKPVGAGSPRPILSPVNQGGETPVNQGGGTPPLPTLAQIVGYFKYQTTKQINVMRNNSDCPVWQRNYYERVIRNERELDAARKYIRENLIKWDLDHENPIIRP
jgi:REP element-mobilizing transposase RayT